LTWGELRLDPSSCEVSYGSTPLLLTPKEYALLELFLRNNRRVFSCSMILEHLWAYEAMPGEEAVRTHIKGLRQKFKAVGLPNDMIETVYGIGYRLKPNEAAEKAKSQRQKTTVSEAQSLPANRQRSVSDPSQNGLVNTVEFNQQQTLASIDQLWHRFKERVSEQVSVLEQATIALWQKKLDQDLWQQARQEAHTLAGSLGTFGLQKGSQLAQRIDRLLQAERISAEEVVTLREWVIALRQEIERSPSRSEEELRRSSTETAAASVEDHRPLLLIVERDQLLAHQLSTEATQRGFRATVAANLLRARDKVFLEPPDVVLLDLGVAPTAVDSLALLTDLNKHVPSIPVVIIAEQDSFTERLELARLGRCTFLQNSLSPLQMLETVDQVLHDADRAKARVMVVDDDLSLLAIVRSLLEPWGLKITTLADPQHFWDVLEATTPDLLILDIEMPHINGIELCQLVRNDSRWGSLPVLFLTAHTNAETVNQVFAAGADDFVSKPLVGPELVTRIINRLERIRFLRNLAETDPLTRLANRQKSTYDLEMFLRLANRQNQPLSLAVVDLAHFQQRNDGYGHATGDEVLRQIGQLLRRSFRAEDVVARWGSGTFVIGMYGITKQKSAQRLSHVLTVLHQHIFTALDGAKSQTTRSTQLQVTFSAGVAQYPEDGSDLHSLYQAANAATCQVTLDHE
jgi:diguanylate cyclase (GGDEF)-like protein